jgi:hypothetical protein
VNRKFFFPYILIFTLVLVVAAVFRVVNIVDAPPAFYPDEANMAVDALSIMQGHVYVVTPHEGGEGALYAYLLALTFALFGKGILQARLLTAVLSVISTGIAFAFLFRLLAPRLGNWPALAISTFAGLGISVADWYVTVSRQAFPQPLAVLVQVACLAAIWRSLHAPRRSTGLLAGILLGLTAYTYVPFKLTPFVLLIYFLLDRAARGQESFLARHFQRLVTIAAIGGAFYVPILVTLVSQAGQVGQRAGQFTFLSPAIHRGNPWATVLRSSVGNVAGFLPLTRHIGDYAIVRAMDDLTALLFVVGLIVVLARWRQPEFLLLPVWWAVMLVPSIIAPEGAIPHLRRAIGTAIPTFALTGLGLVIPFAALARRQVSWRRLAIIGSALIIALVSLVVRARHTYTNYYLRVLNDEAVALINHIYDFELAEVMTTEGDESTGYVLPVDSASGALFPESSTLAFIYQGQATYAYIWDDEDTLFDELRQLTKGKTRIGVVHWKVSKHSGADPKQVFDYVLEKWGLPDGHTTHRYFDVDYFSLEADAATIAPVSLTPVDVSFERRLTLAGAAMDENAVAGGLLWAELAWRKTADSSTNYQVALWLEDEAGHGVGQTDKPLLNNLRHQGTGEWVVGAEERDYYLVRVDPATPPGTYRLKAVLYAGEGDGRRLAPLLPDVGADLAVTLGEVMVKPSLAPPDVTTLPIPQRLDIEVGDGLRLLGFDPGFVGPLRPGDRRTLTLWWQTWEPLSKNLAVIVGIGQGEQAWPLSEPQPLGGAGYPTSDWPVGAAVRTFVDLRLPAAVETGDYNLGLRLVDIESGTPLADWVLGPIQVTGRARSFEIPPMMHPVGADFGEQVTLLGYDLDLSPSEEGGTVRLVLYWQAQKEMGTAYKVFVHLLDAGGVIVAQIDREPQAGVAPTTSWLAGEIVVDEIEVPVTEATVATQSIAVGLYDPLTGKRVPVLNSAGVVVGDRVMVSIR